MLAVACSAWTLAGTNTNEYADFSAWPFIDGSFVQDLRGGVVFARTFVYEYGMSDLDRLEGKADS